MPYRLASPLPLLIALLLPASGAAVPPPQPSPQPPALAVAADRDFPGLIGVEADARDTVRRIVAVHETLPVRPGPLVLLYPQWVAGAHSPINTVDHLAGLVITAGGKRLDWRRDPVEMHAFHVDVPAGPTTLDI